MISPKIVVALVVLLGSYTAISPALAVDRHIFGGGKNIADSHAAAGSESDCVFPKDSAFRFDRGYEPNVRWYNNQYQQCGRH